jgi:hypothetical protein
MGWYAGEIIPTEILVHYQIEALILMLEVKSHEVNQSKCFDFYDNS